MINLSARMAKLRSNVYVTRRTTDAFYDLVGLLVYETNMIVCKDAEYTVTRPTNDDDGGGRDAGAS